MHHISHFILRDYIQNGLFCLTPHSVWSLGRWNTHSVVDVYYFLRKYIITRSLLEQKLYKGLPAKPGRWNARCTQGAGGTGGTAQPAPAPARARAGG